MISMDYPSKKLSRIKNPFSSEEAIDSDYADSRLFEQKSLSCSHYDQQKFPNVFQYNDRSRVLVSDSELASEINDASGENIYHFSKISNLQKVEEVTTINKTTYQSQKLPLDQRFSFGLNGNFESPKNKIKYQQQINISTNAEKIKSTQQLNTKPNTISFSYEAPEVKVFRIQQKSQTTQSRKANSKGLEEQQQGKETQNKKTFKPSLFQQLEEEQSVEVQNKNKQTEKDHQGSTPKMTKLYEIGQEIQEQTIDILVSAPVQKQSLLVKEKNKAKILEEQKLNLSAGSEVHSYTQNILENLREQVEFPNQQLEINFQSKRNSQVQTITRQRANHKNMVQSKFFFENPTFVHESTKISSSKKPRKKIFEAKSQKTTYNHHRERDNPDVSQFDNTKNVRKDPSSSQILMKSLNIIEKMANNNANSKLKTNSQIEQKSRTESIVVVPPPSLTITQSPSSSLNVSYSPTPEQVYIQKQILDLNYEISSIETTFDLQTFDQKDSIDRLKLVKEASIGLFQRYRDVLLSHKLIQSQNIYHLSLKRQILLIRQSISKLISLQQKYIQTKQILSSFEEQIKDILLLNARQKYKKIKLLNEAIQVMEKTQTYLSLEVGKIPVLIKTFVAREKCLLEELRDWLKQCITNQQLA